MLYTIKNEFLTVTVDSFGAQMISAKSADGYEYIWQGEKYWDDHAPVLFPSCGNLPGGKYTYRGKEYKLPIHGLVMYREAHLVEKSDTKLVFKFVSDAETFEAYPFCFELNVVFEISGKTLTTKIIPTNKDEKVMPYMVGWHPGFNLWGDGAIGDFRVDFGYGNELPWYPIIPNHPISKDSKPHALRDGSYYLDEEEIYYNDTMIFTNYPKSFSLKDGNGYAKISMRVSENLPFFCIWKEPYTDARFICLEPWNNIFNSDGSIEDFEKKKMATLVPGESEEYVYETTFN